MFKKETEHGLIEIKDNVLYIDGHNQGSKDSIYIKTILDAVDNYKEKGDTAICFGGGSFIIPKALKERDIHCVTVEQNKWLADHAKDKFNYDSMFIECKDFRDYICGYQRFSFVIVDIFNGAIPTGVEDNLQELHKLSTKLTLVNWIAPWPLWLLGACKKLGPTFYRSYKCPNNLYQEIYEIRKR